MLNQLNDPVVLIAFAPGSYGFLLGKWIINNKIAQPKDVDLPLVYNFNDNNHNYGPYYSELFLNSNNEFQEQLQLGMVEVEKLPKYESTALPKLILTHIGNNSTLEILSKLFVNIRIIKILLNKTEAAESFTRKFNNTDAGRWISHYTYSEFIDSPGPDINVTVEQIINLNLDWIKEKL